MPWEFLTDDRGLVRAKVDDEHPGFNETLDDAISSLSPIGEDPQLSTYWIDVALERLASCQDGQRFAGGNGTHLFRRGEAVVAVSDYELFEEESMVRDDFVSGLKDWRSAISSAIVAGQSLSLPDGVTYWAQRNPHGAVKG